MRWSTEDTLKLLGLALFVGAFAIVLQQLNGAQARLTAREEARKKEE
ncbi:hypothetical protein ACHAXT_010811 [Thalassiosira profunda]